MHENDDEFLSDHTIAMRKAVSVCQSLLADSNKEEKGTTSASTMLSSIQSKKLQLDPTAIEKGKLLNLHHTREKALEEWKNLSFETLHTKDLKSVWEFRQKFHQSNRPCRIEGLTDDASFGRVQKLWGTPEQMRQFVKGISPPGNVAWLPVRRRRQSTAMDGTLDPDGRATECDTVKMTVQEWISYLEETTHNHAALGDKYYLKDWHLESWLLEKNLLPVVHKSASLYQVPEVFQNDLLNPFLQAFTKGDYCFVYWGPAGSQTLWHSDVLHSFSWSYNVFGSKEWTFIHPRTNDHFKILQKPGECIFVPAKWKHQVVNLEETLSINRNWITVANLDLCWECLETEIKSIEEELDAWIAAGSSYDWESRESMLRGCVGLDVTAFYLMIIYRVAVLNNSTELKELMTDQIMKEDASFEIYRCADMIRRLFCNDTIQIQERLSATLGSVDIARDALNLGMKVSQTILDSS